MLPALLEATAFSNRLQHRRLDALLKSNYREISEMACSSGNPKDSCSSKRGTEQYYLKMHNEASQAGVRLVSARLREEKTRPMTFVYTSLEDTAKMHLGI